MNDRQGQTHCVVNNCNTTLFNKGISVWLHPFPTQQEMRNKWLSVLKSRCEYLESRSRICSKHFEQKYFDSQRQLKQNAIPTLFLPSTLERSGRTVRKPDVSQAPRTKLDRLLNSLTQSELHEDIKCTMQDLKCPDNLSNFINDDLNCLKSSSTEIKLWVLIKKQDHLITRLMQGVMQNKKHIEVLQKNIEESRNEKKEMEQALENYKYISKCLQEKQATLEEQIEILGAIESRV